MDDRLDYTDDDLTFYLITYRDFARCCWCLTNLRHHYPSARIVIDVDGDDDIRWESLHTEFNADVIRSERLFPVPNGSAIVKRMFQRHLDDPSQRRWFLRIDTDTEIRRRFMKLPDWGYFGQRPRHFNFIQGGCIGMTRTAMEQIVRSGCLDRPGLGEIPAPWQFYRSHRIVAIEQRVQRQGLISLDWMLSWAMEQAGIEGRDYCEIRCEWKTPIQSYVDCAVAHPCKTVPCDR